MKKNIFTTALIAIALIAASCSKMETIDNPIQEEAEVFDYKTYNLGLRFDAQGVDTAEIAVYDADYVRITKDVVSVPGSAEEVLEMDFVSETEPAFIYTPGLANGDDESGFLRIGGKQIKTKVGEDGTILLVIKKK